MRAVLLSLCVAASAQAAGYQKGPYLQAVSDTGITIMWQAPAARATVTVSGAAGDERTISVPQASLHAVPVSGLAPGKRYRYRIDDELSGTQGGEFVTAPATGSADGFSFVLFGDTRSNAAAHRMVVERVRREVPDFILHTGDITNQGAVEDDWQLFFDVERDLLPDNPLYPALGNHDRGAGGKAEGFRRYFRMPGDADQGQRHYTFSYGNARFLVLDSTLSSFALTDQTAWLERELASAASDPRIRHIFVVMHHPTYSTSLHGGNVLLRDQWGALFEKYHVRCVFSGHDHTYEHSFANGVHYVVSGGGGAPVYPRMPKASSIDVAASRLFERVHNFVRVQVMGDFVEIAGLRDDGSLIESFAVGDLPELTRPAPPAQVTVSPAPPRLPVAQALPQPPRGCAGGVPLWPLLLLPLRRKRRHP